MAKSSTPSCRSHQRTRQRKWNTRAHPLEGRSRRHDSHHVEYGDVLRSKATKSLLSRRRMARLPWKHRMTPAVAQPTATPVAPTPTPAPAQPTPTTPPPRSRPAIAELRTRHRLPHRQARRDPLRHRARLRHPPRRHRQVQQPEQSRQHPRREPAGNPLLTLVAYPARPRRRTPVHADDRKASIFRQDLQDFQDGKALDPVDLVNPV